MRGARRTIYGAGYYEGLLAIPHDKVLCIDVETTGLDPEKDEILQLAMVDGDGNELFSSLVHPPTRKRWPKAQEVHGITWKMVKDMPTLEEHADTISGIIDNAELIVGYNIDFDQSMLKAAGFGFGIRRIYDVMDDYAQVWGRWSDRKDDYLWVKLPVAARRFGISIDAHDAASDAKATARLFYAMLGSDEFMAIARANPMLAGYQPQETASRSAEPNNAKHDEELSNAMAWAMFVTMLAVVVGIPAVLFVSCVSRF